MGRRPRSASVMLFTSSSWSRSWTRVETQGQLGLVCQEPGYQEIIEDSQGRWISRCVLSQSLSVRQGDRLRKTKLAELRGCLDVKICAVFTTCVSPTVGETNHPMIWGLKHEPKPLPLETIEGLKPKAGRGGGGRWSGQPRTLAPE